MIWDGKTNCEHKWGNQLLQKTSDNYNQGFNERWGNASGQKKQEKSSYGEIKQGQFCSLCGAWRSCLGLEPTIELYLKHLVGIFDEAKRVLRDNGCCFVNLGDTYAGGGGWSGVPEDWQSISAASKQQRFESPAKQCKLPAKSLCLIPFRFAIEMVNHGWILRNTIIWSKPNPMPSSAKDRFTVDFEYVFFFVKKKKYWFEQQFDDYTPGSDMAYRKTLRLGKFYRAGNQNPYKDNTPLAGDRKATPLAEGRNKRTTWTIPTEAFPEAHFATFPCALVEPMIKAGCPEFVCPKCGKARVKVYEPTEEYKKYLGKTWYIHNSQEGLASGQKKDDTKGHRTTAQHCFKGYTSCSCGVSYEPGVVMDFFSGSGTVGKVAAYLRRNYILIDAKKEYCQMAEERIAEPETGVSVAEQRIGQKGLFEREGQ